jgi:creatinine amidohydrolase
MQDDTASYVFQQMTWEEIAAAAHAGTPIAIPIGATEQHGRHLPVCTDWVLPQWILREAGRRRDLIVGPFLPFRYRSRPGSGGGQHFPGTVSLRATTFMSVLEDVLSELKRCGFRHILLYNWHYENSGFVYEPAYLVSENNPELKIVVIEDVNPEFTPELASASWPEAFPGRALEHAPSFSARTSRLGICPCEPGRCEHLTPRRHRDRIHPDRPVRGHRTMRGGRCSGPSPIRRARSERASDSHR